MYGSASLAAQPPDDQCLLFASGVDNLSFPAADDCKTVSAYWADMNLIAVYMKFPAASFPSRYLIMLIIYPPTP